MGAWSKSGSHLTYSPWLQGNEDPNLPPPGSKMVRGKPYEAPNGMRFNTWLVDFLPDGAEQAVEQTIVDWGSMAP